MRGSRYVAQCLSMKVFRSGVLTIASFAAVCGPASPSVAQELEPRAYRPAPSGLNFALFGYQFTTGNVLGDPTAPLQHLDVDEAAAALKRALRRSTPGDDALVRSLRERYESIHRVHNRVDELDRIVERALVDVEALAARSLDLGARRDAWELDDAVQRLADDVLALERAHDEIADL